MNLSRMWSLAPEPLAPEQEERLEALIQRVAGEVVRRHLASPALVLLETGKPLSLLGNQTLVFLEPMVRAFLSVPDYDLLLKLLENRSRVERLMEVIEEQEEARLERRTPGEEEAGAHHESVGICPPVRGEKVCRPGPSRFNGPLPADNP
ncbi:MAG: hypothetical protein ACOX9B_07470 [Candidatus Xenobium sp.]|jgi:hypothetical protein